MDIFAHGLWTAAAAKAANNKLEKARRPQLNIYWAAFWGIFPDLFAFTIPAAAVVFGLVAGTFNLSQLPRHPAAESISAGNMPWFFALASRLYDVSHSGIIFTLVFLLIWAVRKRPWIEMSGWLLHILIDIPTHTPQFYPTPVFWPVSNWIFTHGVQWSTPWFMIINYSSLVIAYFLLWGNKKSGVNKKLVLLWGILIAAFVTAGILGL